MATSRKRIGGHKAAYTKLKKRLKNAQELANMRAQHMKDAGLVVRSPRLK
jgi:hypothetical protein